MGVMSELVKGVFRAMLTRGSDCCLILSSSGGAKVLSTHSCDSLSGRMHLLYVPFVRMCDLTNVCLDAYSITKSACLPICFHTVRSLKPTLG